MAVNSETFRAGMRRLAGHVCVITTLNASGERMGLTATAVCSVSAEPPTLLICINRQNSSHAAIREAGIFVVNVLALVDEPLANPERFQDGLWTTLHSGAPVLESALVSFDCRIVQAVEVGTHGIVFGSIEALRVSATDAKPLLYAHGSYGGFATGGAARDRQVLGMPNWEYLD